MTRCRYIGDFRDVSGDITGLANEITATYRQVGELESLLTKNKSTQSLSDNVRLEAEDCQVKAGKLSARLWKQLGKSHAEVPKGRLLGSDDVNVSVFSRARWPIYKPRLEQLKSELMVLKQNIMMVFAMAQMNNECVGHLMTVLAVLTLLQILRGRPLAYSGTDKQAPEGQGPCAPVAERSDQETQASQEATTPPPEVGVRESVSELAFAAQRRV